MIKVKCLQKTLQGLQADQSKKDELRASQVLEGRLNVLQDNRDRQSRIEERLYAWDCAIRRSLINTSVSPERPRSPERKTTVVSLIEHGLCTDLVHPLDRHVDRRDW